MAEGMTRGITENDEIDGKSGMDTWEHLEHISVPTIVAIGEHDIPILNERCEILAGRLPNATLRVVKDSAHGPSIDAPDQVAALVHELLRGPSR
jgi:pimeloyl-ACP methyl ester carboxylesterase